MLLSVLSYTPSQGPILARVYDTDERGEARQGLLQALESAAVLLAGLGKGRSGALRCKGLAASAASRLLLFHG